MHRAQRFRRRGFLLMLASGVLLSSQPLLGAGQTPVADAQPPTPAATIGVEALVKGPRVLSGPVRVEGVVNGFFDIRSGAGRELTIIDVKEFASCGLSSCAMYTVTTAIPESLFSGQRPRDGVPVTVVGESYPEGASVRLFVDQVLHDGKVIVDRLPLSPSALLGQQQLLHLTADQQRELSDMAGEVTLRKAGLAAFLAARSADAANPSDVEKRKRARAECDVKRLEVRQFIELSRVKAAGILTADQRAKLTPTSDAAGVSNITAPGGQAKMVR